MRRTEAEKEEFATDKDRIVKLYRNGKKSEIE